MNQAEKNFLFLCGCARSGTTALWRLIAAHPKIAMGMERFIERCNPDDFTLVPDLFEKDRFYTLTEGDTHKKSLTQGGAGEYYGALNERYNDCVLFGDKAPRLFKHYDDLFKNFPNIKIIFIYRNIFDVAQSFEVRKAKPDDSWDRGHKAAVSEWNQSLNQTLKWLEKKPANILPVEYEALFFGDYPVDNISDFLEIELDPLMKKKLQGDRHYAKRLDKERTDGLSSKQKQYIMHNARFGLFKKLVAYKNHKLTHA